MTVPDRVVDAALADCLEALGYGAAAEVVRQGKNGVITLPESLAYTRDGREEAVSALQEAFDAGNNINVIVIGRGM